MSDILVTENVCVDFIIKKRRVPAVRNVSLSLKEGKTLVVLGESGSGKSTYMKSFLKILPSNAIISGTVNFMGGNLLEKSEKSLREIRGNSVAMIYQDSLSALDPMYRVGDQIVETIRAHENVTKQEAVKRAKSLFAKVGIPSPEERMKAYPHEMSGGMRQRAVIAMALACNPKVLLADEPTTALDVTIQKQILRLFRDLQKEDRMAVMMVTHDIGVAAQIGDEIAVLYGGRVVEAGSAEEVLEHPANPYTKALISALPQRGHRGPLRAIDGQPPIITRMPAGCPFSNRCKLVTDQCKKEIPELHKVGGTHVSACHNE